MKTPYPLKTQLIGLLFTLFLSFTTIAQVGIGNTNPNTNSLLEVGDGTDIGGVLLPRVSLTTTNNPSPLTVDVAGMIVYNTNTTIGATGVSPGFYYNDGTDWVRLANNDDWKLTGNIGTIAGTNFLGTTDAQDVVIKANSTERVRIGTTETVINEDSNAYNFRVESDNLNNILFVDGTNDAVGIGTSTPANYSGVAIDRFSVVGGGTTTVVGPNTSWTPVSAFINEDEGVSLYVHNESTTDNGPALETSVSGPGMGIRALHLPNTGSGYAVYGATNSLNGIGVIASSPTSFSSGTGFAVLSVGDFGYTDAVYSVSDERAKKDIQGISLALNKIKSINGVTYKYDDRKFNPNTSEDIRIHYGFLASNIKNILPHAVAKKNIIYRNEIIEEGSTNGNTEIEVLLDAVNYQSVIPVLVEAMKEQQVIIEKQNTRITELEKTIEEINRKLN